MLIPRYLNLMLLWAVRHNLPFGAQLTHLNNTWDRRWCVSIWLSGWYHLRADIIRWIIRNIYRWQAGVPGHLWSGSTVWSSRQCDGWVSLWLWKSVWSSRAWRGPRGSCKVDRGLWNTPKQYICICTVHSETISLGGFLHRNRNLVRLLYILILTQFISSQLLES